MEEVSARWKGDDRARTDHLAATRDRGTPECAHVAVLLCSLHHQAEPVDAWKTRDVVARKDLHLIQILRRDLEARAERMAGLPKVAVASRSTDAQGTGVRAVAV